MRDRNAPLTVADIGSLAWARVGGLLPAVVTDRRSGQVLMLGYMNEEALGATLKSRLVTFYSRARQRLWLKGETSGNRLRLNAVYADCDDDALLVICEASGPTCHLGSTSCFSDCSLAGPGWLAQMSRIIADRARSGDAGSYTRRLIDSGPKRIGQKVGEEGVEVALAGVDEDRQVLAAEAADLLYHLAVLFEARGIGWATVVDVLKERHAARSSRSTVSSNTT